MMQRYRWRYERYVFRVHYMNNLTLPAKSAKRCCKRACSSECSIREQIESKPLYLEERLGLFWDFPINFPILVEKVSPLKLK